MNAIRKYPRTPHVEGSGIQTGDEDLEAIPFRDLEGLPLIIEEKLDGANAGISFSTRGDLQLQSRGHYLVGGPQERQFELFKAWAVRHQAALFKLLVHRYVLYGEWLYAKHTIFYTDLPHYFLEFDVLDTVEGSFLSTDRRRYLLRDAGFIVSVPVLHTGLLKSPNEILNLIGRSSGVRGNHLQTLQSVCQKHSVNLEVTLAQTDPSDQMEGLYLKWEANGAVHGRFKYVRSSFLQMVIDSDSHWQSRPIVPNQLADGVDLFS